MNVEDVEEECKVAKVPEIMENDKVVSQEAHTPCPGPIKKKNRKDMQCIMTVVHTPLLGPATVHYSGAKPPVCLNSGAGVKTYKAGQGREDIRPIIIPDIRKVGTKPRSQKLSSFLFKFDKSPSVVGGQREEFGDIKSMILQWEEMEAGEEEGGNIPYIPDVQPEEGGRRRRSKRMSELCGRFGEEGEEDSSSSQSGSGEGRGEDRCILSYRQLETSDSKDISYRQSLTKTNNPKLCTDSFSRSNIQTSTSSILNTSPYIYLEDQRRSAQQTQSRKHIKGIGGNPGNLTRQDESSS